MNAIPYVLENNLLRIEIVPAQGGRITSLRSLRTDQEFILPFLREPLGDSHTMLFSEGHIGGFDECLPSVSPSLAIGDEARVSDHGDLWRKPWTVKSSNDGLLLQVDAVSRPLRLTRHAKLNDDTLTLAYEILNLSTEPVTWLWCAHPLLQADDGDRILLSKQITEVTVEYVSDESFIRRSSIAWPVARSTSGSEVDLGLLQDKTGGTAYKLFAQTGTLGTAILYRSRIEQGVAIHFTQAELPFLGVWVNAGAWPETTPDRRLTVALEPATCKFDSLSEAENHGMANRLSPGACQSWTITLQILGAKEPCILADFDF